MPDSRFFKSAGPFTLKQIAEFGECELSGAADPERLYYDVGSLQDGTEKEAPAPVPLVGKLESVPSTGYAHAFSMFSKALREGIFQKLVLSRRTEVPCPAGFSWVEAFRAACRRYVHSYIYLFYAPQTGFWLGATPEILLKGRHGEFETVALAGTQWLKNGKLAERWSEKNVREQGYVADYIGDCLRGQGIPFSEEGPVTVTAGELAHLKTVFRFSISATMSR